MSWVRVELEGGAAYRPGETVRGTARWELDSDPSSVEVRLFWHTRGKGTQDVEVVATQTFDLPARAESRPFALSLPEQPYSFSGKLISLCWAVEAEAQPSGEVERADITVSPTGSEILLPPPPDEASSGTSAPGCLGSLFAKRTGR